MVSPRHLKHETQIHFVNLDGLLDLYISIIKHIYIYTCEICFAVCV